MKNKFKTGLLIAVAALSMAACKGGFSGHGQDSTMVDKNAMDSTAKQNTKAGTLGGPQGDSSTRNDTSAGPDSTRKN